MNDRPGDGQNREVTEPQREGDRAQHGGGIVTGGCRHPPLQIPLQTHCHTVGDDAPQEYFLARLARSQRLHRPVTHSHCSPVGCKHGFPSHKKTPLPSRGVYLFIHQFADLVVE